MVALSTFNLDASVRCRPGAREEADPGTGVRAGSVLGGGAGRRAGGPWRELMG